MEKKIKNNFLKKKYLYYSLLRTKNSYGFSLKETHSKNFPYILGIRYKNCIININSIIQPLKRSLKLLNDFKGKKILIIYNTINYNFLKKYLKFSKNVSVLHYTKLNGFLTNYKNNLTKKKLKKPDLILNLGFTKDTSFLKEAYFFKIPVIHLTNIKKNNIYKNYSIIYNSKQIQSNFFIIYLFRKILKKIQK